jgi:hypothetical protein
MNYQTGSASSSTDLLQKLVTWLVSIGWNQDRSATEGSGWTASLDLNGNFVHLRAVENEANVWQHDSGNAGYGVDMYIGTGYNSGQPFNNQAGGPIANGQSNPVGVGMNLSVGPFSNYYFFADSPADNVVVVVEKSPGLYCHIGWGLSIQKAGSFTGGQYFFGSSSGYYATYPAAGPNTPGFTSSADCPFVNRSQIGGGCAFVRVDVDSFTGKWISIWNSSGGPDQGYTGKQGDASVRGTQSAMQLNFPVYAYSQVTYQFQYEQTSQQDGRANLLPPIVWALRDGTSTGFSMLGTLPNVFWTNAVGSGFSNAEEYLLGADTYKLFPNFAVLKQ